MDRGTAVKVDTERLRAILGPDGVQELLAQARTLERRDPAPGSIDARLIAFVRAALGVAQAEHDAVERTDVPLAGEVRPAQEDLAAGVVVPSEDAHADARRTWDDGDATWERRLAGALGDIRATLRAMEGTMIPLDLYASCERGVEALTAWEGEQDASDAVPRTATEELLAERGSTHVRSLALPDHEAAARGRELASRDVTDLPDPIPGAFEQAEQGRRDAREGRTVPLEELDDDAGRVTSDPTSTPDSARRGMHGALEGVYGDPAAYLEGERASREDRREPAEDADDELVRRLHEHEPDLEASIDRLAEGEARPDPLQARLADDPASGLDGAPS